MKKFLFLFLCQLFAVQIMAKGTDANVLGHVVDKKTGEHLPHVVIVVRGTTIATTTDVTGHYFLKNLPVGNITLEAKFLGYNTSVQTFSIKKNETKEINFELEQSNIALNEVVVSSNRMETYRRLAPTLVKVVDNKLFGSVNANNLSQGLSFQPGVRVENNCQNCGFNQVRINGLDGRYSQLLIDSRPVMSALAGVYGLEQIPTNMIERVEVVRGGGSALYGSSAIAGVLNIITKEPTRNSFTINESLGLTGMKEVDNNLSINGSVVSEDGKAGAMFFGQLRNRQPWDKDGDGFSEIGILDSRALGGNFYFRTSDYSRLTAEVHSIQESRRGGDHLVDVWPPHVAAVAEAIDHSIHSGNLKFSNFSSDGKRHFQAYMSAQMINRKSYYGGVTYAQEYGIVGKPLPKDEYGDNYGDTKGRVYMGGLQYSVELDKLLFMPAQVLVGAEYVHDRLSDVMPIRNWQTNEAGVSLYPTIKQSLNNWSQIAQVEWKSKQLSLLLGARLDEHSSLKNPIFSPRITMRYNLSDDINLRATYAKGFRAPQVFDEDLHIGIVGGEAQRIVNASYLKPEVSHSYSISADIYHNFAKVQTNLLVEGFYTRLQDVFVNNEEDDRGDGFKHYTRINGSGAKVLGVNLEGKLAFDKVQLQAGLTLTSNKFDKAEEWGERTALTSGSTFAVDGSNFAKDADGNYENQKQEDRAMTRTPNAYGYFTLGWNPIRPLNVAFTGTFTGKMKVPHAIEWGVGSAQSDIAGIAAGTRTEGVADASEAAPRWDELVESPAFFDLGTKVSYDFKLSKSTGVQLYTGLTNIFNSYQKDFDKGASRDSGYIYGPTQPRTFYMGCKLSF